MNRPIGRLLLVLAVLVPGTLTTFADPFVCDLNDGRIDLELNPDGTVLYEMDVMYGAFNVYRGEVDVMISAGIYTQDIAGVAGAARWCDRSTGTLMDGYTPPLGHIAFYVATGTRTDGESFPGQTSAQSDRPHHHACHPCTADTDCAGGLYCSKAPGNCAGKGVCARPPTACPDVWQPVCACGGVTYGNACDAAAAGANIAYNGECRMECLSNTVCGAGEYCEKPAGAWCGGVGLCTRRPEVCTTHIDPVCGCDGQTYQNACWAANSGVSIRHDGACGTPCTDNAQCTTSQYCQKAGCGGPGECQQRPQGCTTLWLPVCGCDHMTYGNDCEAQVAGVNVHHAGECGPCTSNAECFTGTFLSGEYCAKPDGQCSAIGTCTLRPEVCPDVESPVCGCNGSIYENYCVAHRSGTNVADWSLCTP